MTRWGERRRPEVKSWNAQMSEIALYSHLAFGCFLKHFFQKELLALGSGRAGLRNIGNTVSEEFSSQSIIWGQHGYSAVWLQCFLNAVVQCLSHTRGLRDYCLLKSYKHDKFSKEEPRLTEGKSSNHPSFICMVTRSFLLIFIVLQYKLSLRYCPDFGIQKKRTRL